MGDMKFETEILRKANAGVCYVKGCERPGKSRVQLTYAKEIERDGRKSRVQTVVNAWACDDYTHRGGR